jgi:hypothetical protein
MPSRSRWHSAAEAAIRRTLPTLTARTPAARLREPIAQCPVEFKGEYFFVMWTYESTRATVGLGPRPDLRLLELWGLTDEQRAFLEE